MSFLGRNLGYIAGLGILGTALWFGSDYVIGRSKGQPLNISGGSAPSNASRVSLETRLDTPVTKEEDYNPRDFEINPRGSLRLYEGNVKNTNNLKGYTQIEMEEDFNAQGVADYNVKVEPGKLYTFVLGNPEEKVVGVEAYRIVAGGDIPLRNPHVDLGLNGSYKIIIPETEKGNTVLFRVKTSYNTTVPTRNGFRVLTSTPTHDIRAEIFSDFIGAPDASFVDASEDAGVVVNDLGVIQPTIPVVCDEIFVDGGIIPSSTTSAVIAPHNYVDGGSFTPDCGFGFRDATTFSDAITPVNPDATPESSEHDAGHRVRYTKPRDPSHR